MIDVNTKVIEDIRSGILAVKDEYKRWWEEVKHRINVTSSYDAVSEADVVIIAVNTPLKVWGDKLISLLHEGITDVRIFVDLNPLEVASRSVSKLVRPGTLISLETTIYPGGTEKHLISRLEESGLSIGKDIYVVYAPERIDPGNRVWTIESIPRVIGAPDDASLSVGIRFYSQTLGLNVFPTCLSTAEFTKIYENTFRLVNIAFAQEALMKTKANFLEVIRAIKTKPFGIQVFYPGPYAGGTCLVKDSLLYYSTTGSEIVRKALIVNEMTPRFYASRIYERVRSLGASKILVVGLGYKPHVPYYTKDHLNPVVRVVEGLRRIDPSLVIHKYDPSLPEFSDVSDPDFEKYDVVLKWGFDDWLAFITS